MAHFIGDLFSFLKVMAICITALIALCLVLLAIPKSPFRDLALGLTQRIGATATALAFVPPMDAIPVTGEIYDVAALIGLAYYWYTLFKKQDGGTIILPSDSPSGRLLP
jgi:hypothetical protein